MFDLLCPHVSQPIQPNKEAPFSMVEFCLFESLGLILKLDCDFSIDFHLRMPKQTHTIPWLYFHLSLQQSDCQQNLDLKKSTIKKAIFYETDWNL